MITELQKSQLVTASGLDPQQYTTDADGLNIIRKNVQQEQPAAGGFDVQTPKLPPTTPAGDSPLLTAGKSFVSSALPSLSGGLGAAGGIALGGALAPETGGLSLLLPLIMGIGGGYLGGKGGQELQNAVIPDSWQQNLQQSQQQNPKAALAGNIAAIPLGGLNPSPTRAVKALGTAGKLIGSLGETSGVVRPDELANLFNVGAGAGIGAGQSLIEGGSLEDAVKSAALGALFNKPSKLIGQRIGFHDIGEPIENTMRGTLGAQVQQQPLPATVPETMTPEEVSKTGGAPLEREAFKFKEMPMNKYSGNIGEQPVGTTGAKTEYITPNEEALNKQEAEGGITKEQINKAQANIELNQKFKEELESGGFKPEAIDAMSPAEMYQAVKIQRAKQLDIQKTSDEMLSEKSELQQEGELKVRTPFVEQSLKNPAITSAQPTPQWYDLIKNWIESAKGVKVDTKGNPTDSTGKPIAGKIAFEKGIPKLISLSRERAGADTPFHEIRHALFDVLEQSDRPADQKLIKPVKDYIQNSPDFQAWKAGRDAEGLSSTIGEYDATNAGYEMLHRILNTAGESPLKKWTNDYTAYLKTRFGKHASEEDYRRLLNYKTLYDQRKLGDYGVKAGAVPFTGEKEKQSEESELPKLTDNLTYKEWEDLYNNAPLNFAGQNLVNKLKDKYPKYLTIYAKENGEGEIPNIVGAQKALKGTRLAKTYLGGMTPFKENILNSESSELAPPFSPQVMEHLDSAAKLSDEAGDADKLAEHHNFLQHGVDWSSQPGIKTLLDSPQFDNLDPEHWKQIEDLYNKSLNRVKEGEVKQPPEKPLETPTKPIDTSVKEATPGLPIGEDVKPRGRGSKISEEEKLSREDFKIKEKGVKASQKEQAEFSKKTQDETLAEEAQTAGEWKMIDNSPEPKDTLAMLNGRLRKALERGDMKRINDLVVKHNYLVRKYGLGEDKLFNFKDQKGGLTVNSEESELPKLGSKDLSISKPLDKLDWSTFRPTESALDRVRRDREEGRIAAQGVEEFIPLKDNIYGQHMAPILESIFKENKLTSEQQNKVEAVGIKEFRDKKYYSNLLSPKENAVKTAIREQLLKKQQDQIEAGEPVFDYNTGTRREAKIDPFYWPNRLSPKAIEMMTEHPIEADKVLKPDFIKHQVDHGNSPEIAEKKWEAMKGAYEEGATNLTRFNANRKMEGVGLPDSMMRPGLVKNLSAYFNRVSSDRAYHDTFEKNPDLAKVVGIKNDAWGNPIESSKNDISGNPYLKDIMESIHGEPYDKGEKALKVAMRGASALFLGPMTNYHIAMSSMATAFQQMKPLEAPGAYAHALTHMGESIQHIAQTGIYRKQLNPIREILDGSNSGLERANALTNLIGNISGRDITNRYTKGMLQGLFEYLTPIRINEAKLGDKTATEYMKRSDPEWSAEKEYSPDDIIKVASNAASFVHGAHDARTLPGWMLKDTAIQPFFSLMSWNIAQTNHWMRHVMTPAKQGNFTPLIMSTLGAVLGGYVIKQGREAIMDKKSPIPSLSEIINSSKGPAKNWNNIAYNLSAMASYTGFMGILSTGAKALEDINHKNIPQGAVFPLDEVLSGPATRITQFASAMMNDPDMDYFQAGTKLATTLAKENIQLGRIATSWLANTGALPQEQYAKELNKKTTDLRRFEMVEGMPYESQTPSTANPFMDMAEKNFKRTENIPEAAAMLPDLIHSAFEKANKAGGNIDVLKKELNKVKENSYETMPSPDRVPQTFIRYLNFLSQTQGANIASERLIDYIRKNEINKVKSELVPSL